MCDHAKVDEREDDRSRGTASPLPRLGNPIAGSRVGDPLHQRAIPGPHARRLRTPPSLVRRRVIHRERIAQGFEPFGPRGDRWPVCQTDAVPLPHGQAPGAIAGGRLGGRWRYNRAAGRGIALSYDSSMSRTAAARLADVHDGGRLAGRWRYNRVAACGIALSYDDRVSGPPPSTLPQTEPTSSPPTHPSVVRVLCYCGDLFTFDGDGGTCPGCGRPAEWPTMGELEREMRSDLEELLRAHEQGSDPD